MLLLEIALYLVILLLTWLGAYLRDPSVLSSFTTRRAKAAAPVTEG